MSRPLGLGERGVVTCTETPVGRFEARVYFRDFTGRRRRAKASGASRSAARRAVTVAVDEALRAGGEFKSSMRFEEVAVPWLVSVAELVARGARSPTTYDTYERILRVHVVPGVGRLRISEFTPGRFDRFLERVHTESGYATAKLCRTVLSGVCAFLVRRDALTTNPIRDVSNLERGRARTAKPVLTQADVARWLQVLDGNEHAVRKDLPDLVRLLLGTGLRLGEALGLAWADVDLDARVLVVQATVVRVRGEGLVRKQTKSSCSDRTLLLPQWCALLLARRRQGQSGLQPVFPDAKGGWRDRNNVSRDLRTVRAGTDFEWFVSHTARRTVATLLDHDGLSARSIADQLGHSRVSMTQDVYMGRSLPRPDVARSLDGLFAEGSK